LVLCRVLRGFLGSASRPAVTEGNEVTERKKRDCVDAVDALIYLMKEKIRARDIMTKKAFENAIVVMLALGGNDYFKGEE